MHLKIGTRLWTGFGILLVLLLALTAVAANRMANVDQHLVKIVEMDAPKLRLAIGLRDAVRDQATAIRDVVLQDDLSFKKSELKRIKDVSKHYATLRTELQSGFSDAATQQVISGLTPLEDALKNALASVIEHALNDDAAAAGKAVRDEIRPAQIALVNALDKLIASVEAEDVESAKDAAATYHTAILILWSLGGVAVVMGGLMGFGIIRSIVPPLHEAVLAAERIAASDLTDHRLPASTDEVGQLMTAMTRMAHELSASLSQVQDSSSNIHMASAEIASGTMDLSVRTEETASTLMNTSQSVAALTEAVRISTAAAHSANKLVQESSGLAVRGGEVVSEVVNTMQDIHQSSSKISDIIGVIDGIAFQTNILALNAAVEAARAGEQGRGFAVVASEVRSLAGRSAAAAREIKTLIETSVGKVSAGAALVNRAGESMTDIVTSVQRVTEVISQISAASVEQNKDIEDISRSISSLDQMTHQNAALVEQSAAAAESLKVQAERLAEVVGVFKLTPSSGQLRLQ